MIRYQKFIQSQKYACIYPKDISKQSQLENIYHYIHAHSECSKGSLIKKIEKKYSYLKIFLDIQGNQLK